MVKLRLKRFGKKRNATYRIVAIDSRSRRQGRPLQELGFYNPRSKETVLQAGEILRWMRQGAQATETLEVILRKAGIYDLLASGKELPTEPIRIAGIARAAVAVAEPEVAVETAVAEAAVITEAAVEETAVEADVDAEVAVEETVTEAAEAAADTEVVAETTEETEA